MNARASLSTKVLLVEDDENYAKVLGRRLSRKSSKVKFEAEHIANLKAAIERLKKKNPDVILLDLHLPDSKGLQTLSKIHAQAPDVPVVVLTGLDDERSALESLRQGAQDYILKGQPNEKTIPQALQYAIERNRLQSKLRETALTDELTGLYNRRAFSLLAHQQLKLSMRTKKGAILFFFDVDHFKEINDKYGHAQGDQALTQVAEALRSTFRKSDVIARIGGDEFAVLALEAGTAAHVKIILSHLHEKLADSGREKNNAFSLSLSAGTEFFVPHRPSSLEALLNAADRAMYRDKRAKETAPSPPERKTVLVIDDEPEFQKILKLRLSKLGFEVVTASDGFKGLKEARRQAPDLIILDLMLPGLSGEEVCKAIREDEDEKFAGIPILMLTAKSSDVDRIIGKVIGADCYLTKPFEPKTLLAKIEELIGR